MGSVIGVLELYYQQYRTNGGARAPLASCIGKGTDCPTVPILSGRYRFEGLCSESRLYLSRDNECPTIGVLEYTCSTMAELLNYNGRGDVS